VGEGTKLQTKNPSLWLGFYCIIKTLGD